MATGRAKNGQAAKPAFLMEFDLTNPAQQKAWDVAQRKAKHYGVRKALINAFLIAVDDFERLTGHEMTADLVSGFFMARAMSGVGLSSGVAAAEPPTPIPKDEIIVVSSQKASARDTAHAMLGDMGNMFG